MTVRVVLGTILVAATMILTAFMLVSEPARMADFELGYQGRSVETGAALFATNCVTCHGAEGQGIEGVAPALRAKDLLDETDANGVQTTPARLKEIGWAGSVRDYIKGAIAGGRPRASAQFLAFPNRMPTWSQEFGGPLRPDQIENLTDFVMNWQGDVDQLPDVTPTPNPNAVGTDLNVELPEGDAANGELLFTGKVNGQYPCYACHSTAENATLVGPSLFGIGTRAATQVDGYTAEQYLHESIVSPNAHVTEGFAASIMPQTFGAQMSKQDLADVLAYLLTLE